MAPRSILFFGADVFSCRVFEKLSARFPLSPLTVVTPDDSRTGRRLKEVYRPPLRTLAEELGRPVAVLPKGGFRDFVLPCESDLLVTASFGYLIPNSILERYGELDTLNVHPSLLPKYRGAAPIQWALINGDSITGVSVQSLSRNTFDKGRLFAQERYAIDSQNDTYLSLESSLADVGGRLLTTVIADLEIYQQRAAYQDESKVVLAPKLTKRHSYINWKTQSASQIINLQKGISHHFPLHSYLVVNEEQLPVQLKVQPLTVENLSQQTAPGSVHKMGQDVRISCADSSALTLETIKMPGGKWISPPDWLNGLKSKQRDGTVYFV